MKTLTLSGHTISWGVYDVVDGRSRVRIIFDNSTEMYVRLLPSADIEADVVANCQACIDSNFGEDLI
jgi:predicted PolB exonuclease-like 3'-5' exonuclease